MRKFSKFGVAAVLASSIISSAAANWYDNILIGAEIGSNFASVEPKDNVTYTTGGTYSVDSSSGSVMDYGIKVGYDFDLWRVYGAFIYNNGQDFNYFSPYYTSRLDFNVENDSLDFLLGAAWTPQISNKFKMLLGPYLGYSVLRTDVSLKTSNSGVITSYEERSYTQNGIIYGARLGGIFTIAGHHEIDFGVKYDSVKYSDKDRFVSGSFSFTPTDIKRSGAGIYVGYNYKF